MTIYHAQFNLDNQSHPEFGDGDEADLVASVDGTVDLILAINALGLIGSESTASLEVSISTDAIGEQDAGEIDGFAHQFQVSRSVSGSLSGGVDIVWSLGSSGQAEFIGHFGVNNALTGTLHVSDQGNDATLSLNIPLTVAGQTAPAEEELLLQDIKAFIDFKDANLGIKDLATEIARASGVRGITAGRLLKFLGSEGFKETSKASAAYQASRLAPMS